jgi:nicotinamidase-related amidase
MSARSLRQIAGVAPFFQPGSPLAAGKTALLLIDYQMAYRQGPLALPGEAAITAIAVRLRAWAEAAGLKVIHVQHVAPAGSPLFAAGSPDVEALPDMAPADGQTVIVKRLPSAFAGTELADALAGLETLLIAGYMTHNCVDATARDAFHRGYRVGIVADACATRDLPGRGDAVLPATVVHAAVLAGLGDRIAEIVDLATVQAMAVA